ncbi:unnamed protein product [Sympodiomycopsis kandeliae]
MIAFLKYLLESLGFLFVLALILPQGRRLLLHCVRVLLNGKSPIRWLVGLLAGILPPVCWTLAFKLARNIPSEWRPEIHTHLLPILEASLLSTSGIVLLTILLLPWAVLLRVHSRTTISKTVYPLMVVFFPLWLKLTNVVATTLAWTPFQDVLAWIFYGVLHFASPFLAGWWLWGFAPPGVAIVYGLTLGIQNLSGLLTHLVFPNAAPWYYDVYPAATIPTYDFPGNPAGLVRVDVALGTHLYQKAFQKSPVVFGALPSLHAASATCFSFFVARYGGKWGHVVMVTYSTLMFWSTQYLRHHWAVDLLAGTLYSVLAFHASLFLLRRLDAKHEREASTRGVDRLFCLPAPHANRQAALPLYAGNEGQDRDSSESWGMEELGPGKKSGSGKKVRFWTSDRSATDEEKGMLSPVHNDEDDEETPCGSKSSSRSGSLSPPELQSVEAFGPESGKGSRQD